MMTQSFGILLLLFGLPGAAWCASPPASDAVAASSSSTEGKKTPNEIADELLNLRDPFKRVWGDNSRAADLRTPLEKFAATSFKLVGVQTGPGRRKAVLLAPDGMTYIVGERVRVGVNNGMVARISADRLIVKERIHNVLGQLEEVSTTLELMPDIKTPSARASDAPPPQVTERVLSGSGKGPAPGPGPDAKLNSSSVSVSGNGSPGLSGAAPAAAVNPGSLPVPNH